MKEQVSVDKIIVLEGVLYILNERSEHERLKRLDQNLMKSIASLVELDKSRRFVFTAEELFYFLEGLCI